MGAKVIGSRTVTITHCIERDKAIHLELVDHNLLYSGLNFCLKQRARLIRQCKTIFLKVPSWKKAGKPSLIFISMHILDAEVP